VKNHAGRKFILTDTVFSMDGDLAPLDGLRRLGADVVIDDVHGLGVFGPEGRGNVDAPIQTGNLAKAAGSAGGFVTGSKDLIEVLKSRARAFLFTTAPPAALCAAGIEALRIVRAAEDRRAKLWQNIKLLGGESPIHTVILGSNERALEGSRKLFDLGFFVPAIRPPTVAEGTARLRVTVTAMHEREHVEALLEALRKI
jgi:8-amino-7-oxononanoate synthase